MSPLLPAQKFGLKSQEGISERGWGDFHHWPSLISALGKRQSTLEDKPGGLPDPPKCLTEGCPSSFGVWKEARVEVLDREPGTGTCPDLRGHLLGSVVHLDLCSKGDVQSSSVQKG